MVLTIVGATGMILGAFAAWLHKASAGAQQSGAAAPALLRLKGTRLSGKAFFSPHFHVGHFEKSAGMVMIVLGLVALVGLAPRSGWLTRIAGALGIVAFALFAIEIVRSPQMKIANIGIGAWVCLIGAVLSVIGGFFGTRGVVGERH